MPRLPSVRISGVSVSNSGFLGPVDLELNAQYNALIGGRGTGKSTILEYLRWALCDQPPGLEGDDAPNYQRRRSRLIDQTLKPQGETVEVSFVVNGVPHMVRRYSEDGSTQIKIASSEMRPCSEEEVRGLLPIQAYSQKQLSELSVRIEELNRFITTSIRMQLAQFGSKIEEAGERIKQTYSKWQRQRTLQRALRERELEANSLSQQAESLRSSLTGLSDENRRILDQGPEYEAADELMEGWRGHISSLAEGLESLIRRADTSRLQADKPGTKPEGAAAIMAEAYEEHQELLGAARESLRGLKQRAVEIETGADDPGSDSPWAKWRRTVTSFRGSYEAAVQRSSAHTAQMEQLREIERRLSDHRRETSRLREELKTLDGAKEAYANARADWHRLGAERDALIDEECAGLTANSSGIIRARVRRYADASHLAGRLRDALSGTNMRKDRFDRLAEAISTAENPAAKLEELLMELEALAEHDAERDGVDSLPRTPALKAAGMSTGDVQRIATALTPEAWLSVALTPVQSQPEFEYRAREGQYIPFSNASEGQQATALLKTLLSQEGPPLIIDQPEEDLDNEVIL